MEHKALCDGTEHFHYFTFFLCRFHKISLDHRYGVSLYRNLSFYMNYLLKCVNLTFPGEIFKNQTTKELAYAIPRAASQTVEVKEAHNCN